MQVQKSYGATKVQVTMSTKYKLAIEAMNPAITQLLANYEGFGGKNQVETDEKPESEITDFLQMLDIYYPGAGKRKLKLAIRQFITQLACFRYRVLAKKNNQTVSVWNPLEQSLAQFLELNSRYSIVYYTNKDPYPTVDIISDWVSCHIKENISSDD